MCAYNGDEIYCRRCCQGTQFPVFHHFSLRFSLFCFPCVDFGSRRLSQKKPQVEAKEGTKNGNKIISRDVREELNQLG